MTLRARVLLVGSLIVALSLGAVPRAAAQETFPFALAVGGWGVFPGRRRPRVVWIGVHAPAELEALQHSIEAAAARLGYPGEKRAFSPHLTIGRVKQHTQGEALQSIRSELEATQVGLLGTARITSLNLFKSELKPTGAVYTRLFSAPLAS